MSEDWRPSCELDYLRLRAQVLAEIRQFFFQRQVLEVETPLLCQNTGTDPQLDFFATNFHYPPFNKRYFLQTSPEFAMKKLLAAGSGSIYQICKAFRNSEIGRYHNPEFTLLEWYRIDFDLFELMNEVAQLLQVLFKSVYDSINIIKISYQNLFQDVTGLNPLFFNFIEYKKFAITSGYPEALDLCGSQHVLWLDFIFSHCVQPALSNNCVYMVYWYPAVMSSLARLNLDNPMLTERFEVFVNRIELANGYFELTDDKEQESRFDREIAYRLKSGLSHVEKDRQLLAALKAGLPECSGVALGLDRLLMIVGECQNIQEVLTFPFQLNQLSSTGS